SYWFAGDDGCVAYADTGGAWVVAGSPIAPLEGWPKIVPAFLAAAAAARRRVVFFAVEQRFLDATGLAGIQVGEQPIWDPALWQQTLAQVPSLRKQVKRAQAKGVVIRRLEGEQLTQPDGAERLG